MQRVTGVDDPSLVLVMSDDVPSLAAPRPLPNLSGHHLVIPG